MTRLKLIVACAAVLLASGGCRTRLGDLTVATPKNVPVEMNVVKQNVKGVECSRTFLFIPMGILNPTIDGAIDNALENLPDADALTNAVLHNDILFALLYAHNCMRIEGTAIRTK